MKQRKSAIFGVAGLALLMLAGCSYNVQNATSVGQVAGVQDVDPEYFIQVGDVVRVALRTAKNPTEPEVLEVPVRPDGKVYFDLLEEEVLLAGYTPDAVRRSLTEKYSALIKNPFVSVNIVQFGQRAIYVGGEVRDIRERFAFERGMTATRAILAVGLDTYRGEMNNVIVVRQTGNGNKPVVMQLRLRDALENKAPEQDIALRPNDIVFVPPKGMVQAGDVIRQINGLVPLPGLVYPIGVLEYAEARDLGDD